MQASIRQRVYFLFALVIAVGYGLVYGGHRVGVSPFHLSARLPGLDLLVLLITVVLPLTIGLVLGCRAGKLGWYVLPLYPAVVALSLF